MNNVIKIISSFILSIIILFNNSACSVADPKVPSAEVEDRIIMNRERNEEARAIQGAIENQDGGIGGTGKTSDCQDKEPKERECIK
jgi:hypothetical protein